MVVNWDGWPPLWRKTISGRTISTRGYFDFNFRKTISKLMLSYSCLELGDVTLA